MFFDVIRDLLHAPDATDEFRELRKASADVDALLASTPAEISELELRSVFAERDRLREENQSLRAKLAEYGRHSKQTIATLTGKLAEAKRHRKAVATLHDIIAVLKNHADLKPEDAKRLNAELSKTD